jgi:hypothetical protein
MIYCFIQKNVSHIRKKTFYLQNRVKKKMFCAKNSYGTAIPTKFAGSTQNHEKMLGPPNQPINMNIFPKKVGLVPQK